MWLWVVVYNANTQECPLGYAEQGLAPLRWSPLGKRYTHCGIPPAGAGLIPVLLSLTLCFLGLSEIVEVSAMARITGLPP